MFKIIYLMLKQTADPNVKVCLIIYLILKQTADGKEKVCMIIYLMLKQITDPNGKPFICFYGEILFKLLKHLNHKSALKWIISRREMPKLSYFKQPVKLQLEGLSRGLLCNGCSLVHICGLYLY